MYTFSGDMFSTDSLPILKYEERTSRITMKVIVAIAPEKYRDEELAEPLAAFTEAGITFDIASTRPGTYTECSAGKRSPALHLMT